MENYKKFLHLKNRYNKTSRSARNFCKPAAEGFHYDSSGGVRLGVQSRQVCLYSGIVDTQEFGRASHHINIKMLALGPFLVHELEDRVSRIRMLEDDAGDLEQCLAQMRGAPFGDAAGLGVECAGLKGRRVHARKSHQSAGC